MVTLPHEVPISASRTDNALAGALLIGNSALWSFLAVVVVRMPYSGVIWLMGPVLCTLGALGEPDRALRARSLFCNLVIMGMLQFVFAALRDFPSLLTTAVMLAILLTGGRDGNNAGVTICASLLDIAERNVGTAAEILLLTLGLAVVIPLTGWCMDSLLFGGREWGGLGTKPPLTTDALIRRMAAFAAGFAMMYAFGWQYGHWIPLTVALSYSGGDTAFGLRNNLKDRFCGSALGLAASLLWLGTVCYADYRFSYLAAGLLPAAFYYSIRTGDHLGFCIMYMMICGTLDDLIRGASPLYGNGWQFFFQSAVGIAVGAIIVEAIESGAAAEERFRLPGNRPRSTAGCSAPCGNLSAESPVRR